jgi:ethanolamine utilization protein EutA
LEESQRLEGPILHMDIGGGTTNLALLEEGKILRTGCLNVGGRLIKMDEQGTVTYISPVLSGLTELTLGQTATRSQLVSLAQMLVEVLEMAAGLRQTSPLWEQLSTQEAGAPFSPAPPDSRVILSGGVAECVRKELPPFVFGDLGPILGSCIRDSRLQGRYTLGAHTIRATVIGAGCHAAQLSGSTVYARDVALPMKNITVATFTRDEQQSPALSQLIQERASQWDSSPLLYFPGFFGASYSQITRLATAISQGTTGTVLIALEQDMAKALGQVLTLQNPQRAVLCLDGLTLSHGDYLDIGEPLGPTFPVVIKTLAMA